MCYAPHAWHGILHMLDIMSPYMLFSSWFLHILLSICYSPHGLSACVLMLDIMSPYVILLMVWVHVSLFLKSCLHMLCSSCLVWHSPHARHHVPICYSPHALHAFSICYSPYAIPLMVCMALSTCLTSCLHMLFSSWFAWHSPHD